jgi:hypothetical protein
MDGSVASPAKKGMQGYEAAKDAFYKPIGQELQGYTRVFGVFGENVPERRTARWKTLNIEWTTKLLNIHVKSFVEMSL